MNRLSKILCLMVVSIMLICSCAFATNHFEDSFNELNNVKQTNEVTTGINILGGTVIDIVQTVGYAMAIIMVIVVGIQWVMATPSKKQELKGRMWNLVIGAALIAGSVTFLGIVESTSNALFGTK